MTDLNLLIPPLRLRRSPLRSWLQHLNVAVLKRSLLLTLIIGSVLTLVTQSAALFSDAIFERLPLVLAFVTPFVVITVSQLGATHQAVSDAMRCQTPATNTRLIETLVANNIPFRALVIGLVIGSVNSLLILANTFSQTGDITDAPLPLLMQVYVLPFVFGALSQALAYRRFAASSAVTSSHPRSY